MLPGIECSIEVTEEGLGENGQGGIDIYDKILIGLLSTNIPTCLPGWQRLESEKLY